MTKLQPKTSESVSAQPAGVEPRRRDHSAEDRFEQFVQAEIARSPNALRELGEYLGRVLDEDKFPTANSLLLQLATEYTDPPAPAAVPADTFQADVSAWMGECFLPSLYSNMTERGDRLLEELLETLQSHGYDKARVPTLVDYVYGRPVGEPAQEVGGVMVTLAAYCWVAGLDMHAEGARELARITQPEVMAKIRRKQEAKNALHFDTPLPGGAPATVPANTSDFAELVIRDVSELDPEDPDAADTVCIQIQDLQLILERHATHPQPAAAGEEARPMDTAPRDGTMLRLLVEFEDHATEDTEGAVWTIGANSFEDNGDDVWQFAGWCWTHDHFTQGKGTPVGWLPLIDQPAAAGGDA